ncbi:hypothetical protein [Nostoc sp.]|uniref:hypothetical protein n=1 Tax=Nostoc sp. TaxID=1180 RepID=UPI002FFA1FFC
MRSPPQILSSIQSRSAEQAASALSVNRMFSKDRTIGNHPKMPAFYWSVKDD